MKISAVYKVVNEVTNDFYIGSSKDVKNRWTCYKDPSNWKRHLNSSLYHDMQKYGIDKFRFQILAPVMPECLKQVEQEFIDMLHPTYNDRHAKGLNIERRKRYEQSEKYKESLVKYKQSDKSKARYKRHNSRLCFYNNETLRFGTLVARFIRAGIEHPSVEAKKYLLHEQKLIDAKEALK